MQESLKFARVFRLLEQDELRNQSFDEIVKSMPMHENALLLRAYCDIAKYYHDVEDLGRRDSYLKAAQDLVTEKKPPDDALISASLALAHCFFDIGAYEKMNEKLRAITFLLGCNNGLNLVKDLHSYVELAKKIAKHDQIPIEFKKIEAETMINLAFFYAQQHLNDPKDSGACLTIATAYQALGDHVKANKAADLASTAVQDLPDTTEFEISFKISLLIELITFYKATPDKARPLTKLIEALYDRLPNKDSMGNTILNCYNDLNLTEESTAFLKRYLLVFDKKDAGRKIGDLTVFSQQNNHPEQKKALLEAAEKLLLQVDSSEYALALSFIADGYLQIDRQKSLKLLQNYQHSQTTRPLTAAAVTALALGILYLYPFHGIMLSGLAISVISRL
jgi:hypothetical protein